MKILRVLIVDDNTDLLSDTQESTHWPAYQGHNLEIATAGTTSELFEHVTNILDCEGKLPQLIFLDLKFDEDDKDGQDALKWLKEHKKKIVRVIPVVMYSSSTEAGDIIKSYRNRVNEYVPKGDDELGQFWKAVEYWSSTPKIPDLSAEC